MIMVLNKGNKICTKDKIAPQHIQVTNPLSVSDTHPRNDYTFFFASVYLTDLVVYNKPFLGSVLVYRKVTKRLNNRLCGHNTLKQPA